MSRRLTAVAVLASLATLAGGCVTSLPETRYYTLLPPAGPGGGGDGLIVGVETFAVDPPYDQDRLVYRKGESEARVGFYAYHRWAASLGRLLAVGFAEGLAGTPGIAAVEPATSSHGYDARLGGRLVYLEEVDLAGVTEGRIALELELVGSDGEPLWSDGVEARARGSAASGEEVAELLQRAFAAALADARAALAAALATAGGESP